LLKSYEAKSGNRNRRPERNIERKSCLYLSWCRWHHGRRYAYIFTARTHPRVQSKTELAQDIWDRGGEGPMEEHRDVGTAAESSEVAAGVRI
jgi:hypothetical protein